jgi:energy-coupling factor transport system permease protein
MAADHTVWLDRVNPVNRLGAAMILTFPLFISLDWVSAVTVVGLEIAIWLGLHHRAWLTQLGRLARRSLPLLLATPLAFISMAAYGDPAGRIYFHWGLITVSDQSLSYGAAVAARIIAVGMACLVTLIGVDPTDMADGLAQVWHLPARFVLGTLAGVRLIAHLSADWRLMSLARRARGLGDARALRRYATLAFALLVSAIRRGSTLATAMQARGFGRPGRTWARPSRVGWPDLWCLVVAGLIVAAGLGVSWATGHFRWIGSVF